jgi:hypothetical protein
MTDIEICSRPECDTPAQTVGLCNTHYMAHYRERQEMLKGEAKVLESVYGTPIEYACDEDDDCDEDPILLWAPGGNTSEAQALCATHRMEVIDRLRLDLRRLGAKA